MGKKIYSNSFNNLILNYLCLVKNKVRILSVVVLAVIYCFATGTAHKSLSDADFINNSTSSQEKVISDFSAKLFCHTSPYGSSVNIYNNLPAPNYNNQFKGLWAIIKTTEQLILTKFSQYTTFSGNILINHRKSDIIFPFNYFW